MTDETETKRTRKTNRVRWAVLEPFSMAETTYAELPEAWTGASVLDPYLCIGPEFDGQAEANAWLLEHGRPEDEYQLVRVTRRAIRIEQKRSIVQGGLDLEGE